MMELLRPRKLNRFLSKKNLRKFLIVALIILLTGGLAIYTVHKLNSPAYGTISKTTNSATTPITNSTDYSTLNTDYYSLLYPSQFSQNYHQVAAGALAYKYLTVQEGPQPPAASLEVYIKQLPYGGITLDSDYKFYAANSASYKASHKLHNTDEVDLFSKDTNGQERNALWAHGRYLLIIKLHGSTKGQDIDQQIKTITNSVQWSAQ